MQKNLKKIAFKVIQIKFLAMRITNTKMKLLYIYGKKLTKYIHGTWSFHNVLMIFGIKEKCYIRRQIRKIFLTHTVYFWLLLQMKSSFPKRYKSILIVFMKMTFFYLDPYI